MRHSSFVRPGVSAQTERESTAPRSSAWRTWPMMLRLALMFEPGIVITSVPYQVGREGE